MSLDKPTVEDLDKILDMIHDIAAKAGNTEGIPREVDKALDEIIALARYKFNVINYKGDGS